MGYINPPEPADDVVIVEATEGQPAFTWGDHRKMEAFLEELEADNPALKVARQKLHDALVGTPWEPGHIEKICQWCWKKETEEHDPDCRDYDNSPVPIRDAGGYQYLTDTFQVVETTSVPMNDDEAIDYFRIVQAWFFKETVKFVQRREINGHTYKMLPYFYDKESGGVLPIVRSGA